jgi:L-seryl-tRNA(Ser) seleniumtransferase
LLIDLAPYGLGDEPVVRDILKAGVNLVMFSGDKLLGGPQAGIIAGRRDIVASLKSHPLMRAVRIDKLSLAALEATLRLYLAPHDPMRDIPVLAMLSAPLSEIEDRAHQLAQMLRGIGLMETAVCESVAYAGAGSLPDQDLPSFAVSVTHPDFSPDQLAAALRRAALPVIGRILHGSLMLDMRTVTEAEVAHILSAFAQISAP